MMFDGIMELDGTSAGVHFTVDTLLALRFRCFPLFTAVAARIRTLGVLHTGSVAAPVMFGCLNIRSLEPKLDDLFEACCERSIHVMLLT
jgi:hypothetical protein